MRHDRGREARAWGARGALTADLDRANVRQVARIDAGGRLPALAPAHVRADGDVHHRPRLAGRVAGAPDDVAVQEAAVDDVQRVEWQRLSALASVRGYKTGWAVHRFREKFGEAPSTAVRGSASPIADPAEQRRTVYDAMLEEEGGNSAWAAVRFRADTGQSAPQAG